MTLPIHLAPATAAAMLGARCTLLASLLVAAASGTSTVVPAAQPGLLARTLGLLGWGAPTAAPEPQPKENATGELPRLAALGSRARGSRGQGRGARLRYPVQCS